MRRFARQICRPRLKKVAVLLFFIIWPALLCRGPLSCVIPALADNSQAIWPEFSLVTDSDDRLMVDATGAADGYFFAAVGAKLEHRVKLRVVKDNSTFTYDLNSDGEYELFPLQLGDGIYEISLYENIAEKKYASAGKIDIEVRQNRGDAAFLVPSQYLNYTKASEAVAMADSICSGMSGKQAWQAVCDFMVQSFVYDYIKAMTVQPGMLPDIDGSFEKRMGVCQDLSAIMGAMLRTQQIPSRLIIGFADDQYHAWTQTMVDGEDLFFDPTAALSAINKIKEYSMERYY